MYPEMHSMDVDGELRIPYALASEGSLVLLHNQEAKSLQISGPRITKVVSKENNRLAQHILHLNPDSSDGLQDSLLVNISYSLAIPDTHKINRITHEWIELNLDSFWQPIISSIPTIYYRVNVDFGGDYTLMSGDHFTKIGPGQYIIRNYIDRRDIPFSGGKKMRKVSGELSEAYTPLEDVNLEMVVQKSDSILHFLKEYTGQDQDFEEPRRVILTPREEVGYSRKNYIAMSDIRDMSRTYLSDYLAHEFSHYWFSNAHFQTRHHWLTESFAEYISMIYMRQAYGPEWRKEDLEKKQERIKDDPRHLSEFSSRPSFVAMYHRGPLVLNAFEEYVGEDSFRQLIRAFIREDVRTTEELFSLVQNELGADAKDKLEELLATV